MVNIWISDIFGAQVQVLALVPRSLILCSQGSHQVIISEVRFFPEEEMGARKENLDRVERKKKKVPRQRCRVSGRAQNTKHKRLSTMVFFFSSHFQTGTI